MSSLLLAHVGWGIGDFWHGLLHPLTGIDHLLAMVAIGLLAAFATEPRGAWRAPAGFVGGMLIGGVLGIAGFVPGFVEFSIGASVVVLGGLLAATLVPAIRVGAWVPGLALAFGGLHGIAHGAEVPGSASPVAYLAGFVAMTIALHLAGVAVGSTVGRNPLVRTAVAGAISVAGAAILVGLPI